MGGHSSKQDPRTTLQLMQDAGRGSLRRTKRFVKIHGINFKANGDTLLHYAAQFDNANAATWLVKNGADMEIRNKHGNTPLMCAAYRGNNHVVIVLLSNGANPNATNNCDSPPLVWACIRKQIGAARLLIGWGADVNLPGQTKMTALHWAVLLKRFDFIDLLIASGAVESETVHAQTPSSMATCKEVTLALEDPPTKVSSLVLLCLRAIRSNKKTHRKVFSSPLWASICNSDYLKHLSFDDPGDADSE